MSWGAFPEDVVEQLRAREWDNTANLRRRLLGERAFPIEVSLKPPIGARALRELDRFRAWLEAWRAWPAPSQLHYEQRNYHQVGRHRVPVTLTVSSMRELIECLGAACIERSRQWERLMAPLLVLDEALYPTLVRNLALIEALSPEAAQRLGGVVPQLRPGIGAGGYLRSVPVNGVDSKFLETHEVLITQILDALHDGAVSAAGGLRRWFDCRDNPSGWLQIRALSGDARKRLCGLAILSLPTSELLASALPAGRILVVENVQSGLALPELDDTITVYGGGQNLAWMRAPWLAGKRVGYWGDLDTWGLKLLGDARLHVGVLDALMMDAATLERFFDRTVPELQPWTQDIPGLLPEERALHTQLLTGDGRACRLEQERIDTDYMTEILQGWAGR